MTKTGIDQWVYVAAPLFFYGIVVLGLAAMGDAGGERNIVKAFLRAIGDSLNKLTGLPGWSMAGALTGLTASGIALLGLYWDVAWHIDNGRDKALFTPSHTMILIGLNGLVFAAAIAIIYATLEKSSAGFRFAGLQVPWSAVVMGAMGIGASTAFPLDNLWHQAYGIDVTLWSPTHLQLVAGGSLGPMAIWLMIREGIATTGARATVLGRGIEALALGAILTGLCTFQGEFDFGMPQFQAVYHPVLVVMAGAMALVAARAVLGAGGALVAMMFFVGLRGIVALLVGGALNHTVPRFPLYLVAAIAVEVVALALGTERRLRFAVAAGVAVATIGMIAEMFWVQASGWGPAAPGLLPKALLLSLIGGVAAAVVGAALSQAGSPGDRLLPAAVVGAGLAMIAVLAVPLPRNTGQVDAVITLEPVGDEARVTVQLDPPDAAENATLFGVGAWQGGGRVTSELEEVGPGRYVSEKTMPITGEWKTVVGLERGSEVMAAPVYMPADAEIGAAAIPALPERKVSFARNVDVLLREAKDGPAWPALMAYAGWGGVMAVWVGLIAFAVSRIPAEAPPAPRPVPPVAAPPANGGWVPRRSWAEV